MLHLVRDPRGIVNSRLAFVDFPHQKKYPITCQRMAEDLNYVMSPTGAEEFTNKYKVIRYALLANKRIKVCFVLILQTQKK